MKATTHGFGLFRPLSLAGVAMTALLLSQVLAQRSDLSNDNTDDLVFNYNKEEPLPYASANQQQQQQQRTTRRNLKPAGGGSGGNMNNAKANVLRPQTSTQRPTAYPTSTQSGGGGGGLLGTGVNVGLGALGLGGGASSAASATVAPPFIYSNETLNETHAQAFKHWLGGKSTELYELSMNYSGFHLLNATYNVQLRNDAKFAWINFTEMIINISSTIGEVLYNKTLVVKNLTDFVERAFDEFRNDTKRLVDATTYVYYDAKSPKTFCDVQEAVKSKQQNNNNNNQNQNQNQNTTTTTVAPAKSNSSTLLKAPDPSPPPAANAATKATAAAIANVDEAETLDADDEAGADKYRRKRSYYDKKFLADDDDEDENENEDENDDINAQYVDDNEENDDDDQEVND